MCRRGTAEGPAGSWAQAWESNGKGRWRTAALGHGGYFRATSMGRALAREARRTPPLGLLKTFAPPRSRTLLTQTPARLHGLQSPFRLSDSGRLLRQRLQLNLQSILRARACKAGYSLLPTPTTEFS